jgi:tRNA A-37 threonylcarbamoyl transferase component Bud32
MLPLSPSKLGRYEIVDEIGKGAMGVVYLARDPLIGRLVALKTFRISYSVKDAELEQFRARFIREAQSAGILSHPNIVTIHDVVERGEEGLAFIAMEYVRGTNLKALLQAPQRQTLTFASEILTQIADGLDYAHSCKVIHRDIKPANILINTENRAKITDFGIARLDTSNLTQEGQLLGTPNYMSPEQILGRDVDHRADIFSLGVVLYEMVTRHKPFQGENLTVVSHRIVYDQFTPPKEYAGDLPPGTDQILAKALEKDPGRRYQRARDMADDLRRVLGSVGVRDTLNETQSLSTTAVLPAHLLRPAAPAPAVPAASAAAAALSPAVLVAVPPLPATGGEPAVVAEAFGAPAFPAAAAWPVAAPTTAPAAVLPYPHSTRPIVLPPELAGAEPAATGGAGHLEAAPVPLPAAAETPAVQASPSADLRPSTPGRAPAKGLFAMPPPARLAAAVAVGLGVGLLLAAGGVLWARAGAAPAAPGSSATRPEASQATRLQVLGLVRDGRRRLDAGDADGAAAAFHAAEQLLPGKRALRQLSQEAERRQGDRRRRIDQERTIETRLDEGRLALADRRYQEAETAALAVLTMSPGNTVAEEILASVKDGRSRAKDRTASAAARQQARTVAAAAPPIRPDAAPRTDQPSTAPAAEAKDATVELGFFSAMPEGTLLVYINGRKVMQESFRFYERSGLFRSHPSTGWVRRTFHLPSGNAEIRVYVTPQGSAAVVRTLSGNFSGGATRRLDVKLSADGDVAAQLN